MGGVNLAGAEFGKVPGVFGTDYIYPTEKDVAYFVNRRMRLIRIPFRWERLQPSLGAPFDPAERKRLGDAVAAVTRLGATAIVSPHNYARYAGGVIGSPEVPSAAFANFWAGLAGMFKDNPGVMLGLMNEPHDMPTEQWRDAANEAIAAIRAQGATNMILVPGNAWTGGHSWLAPDYGVPNGVAMRQIRDPGQNFMYEIHQYLDETYAGSNPVCRTDDVGKKVLAGVTAWLREVKGRAILGEFGSGEDENCLRQLDALLRHLDENRDVWAGWAYWAAGPWWWGTPMMIQPDGRGDRPQMAILRRYLER